MDKAGSAPSKPAERKASPLWLNAEITFRCPLHCVFCYNPVDYARSGAELSTEDWLRVLREARELGAVQLGISGGEPLMRDDVEIMVAEAHRLGYYTNLLTSGVGLTEKRIAAFKDGGLDQIQLSFQDSTRELNDFPQQHPHLRTEVEGRQADQAVRLSDGAERGAAPAQHRSHPGHPGHGRGDGRRAPRARQHPVLRLGADQPRSAAAQPRAAACAPRRSPTSSARGWATR